MSQLSCFKAYDIRGELGVELNEDVAYRIGRAYGLWLHENASADGRLSVVVGGDIRLTSESLKQALAKGLMDSDVDVIDLGMTGTEEIYFATFHLGVAGGVEVTASHNPMNYNGMKLVREGARPVSGDTGLKEIQRAAELNEFPEVLARGTLTQQSCLASYVEHLLMYITPSNISPLKLVVNSGNGAAGHVVDALADAFDRLQVPVSFIKVHHEPDGNFPNGIPNPLLQECREDTRRAVIEHGADMGIAWDGDFDRCFLFDETGAFVEGYYIVGLLAEAFLHKQPEAKIIHDPRLTWNTVDIVEANKGTPVLCKTGHAFIKERMRLEDAVYGGEMSAHHYFREFAYCDSGMIPWLLVTELMCVKQQPLSALVNARIAAFPSPGEINFRLQDAQATIEKVRAHYEPLALSSDTTDGISFEFETWRFNLRSSNTEPVVRLNLETRGDVALMNRKLAELEVFLK
ncbi:phosphomannomutase CpsG [Leucothrix sargassi]|nr:phosphomannomutase CpsG [Leucothrix sargassi]